MGALLEINSRMVRATEELTSVAQALQDTRRDAAPQERRSVGPQAGRSDPSADLLAAIERLTEALQRVQASGRLGVGGIAPLVVPPAELSRRRELSSLLRDYERTEAFSRQMRFATYQQVLDRFGAPDQVFAGERGLWWEYELFDAEGDPCSVRLQFADGHLISIAQ